LVGNEILGFNEKKKEIYFSSTKETPLEKHLYKVNWQTTKITRLDKDAGIHNGILSKDGTHLYDVFANASTPRIANIINTQSLQTKNILTAENPLKNFQRPEIQNITLKADDGTPLYGKLILPTDFETQKLINR
jgi:dipeptidyl-peptidase-4